MRVYADTSVFGGVFDSEFSKPSKSFFEEIDSGRFILVTSAVVAAEIEPSPDSVQKLFSKYAKIAQVADITKETIDLRQNYIQSDIVSERYLDNALHVAIATVSLAT